ncbi:MAG: dihydrodipicolinate synthase family protein [Pseudomonadota bacterium]
MTQSNWRGVFPALTTKFTDDGALDFDAMAEHLEFQLDAGVHGVIILGSLGENSTLTGTEKRDLMRFFSGLVAGRVPLLSCLAECSTAEARAFLGAGDAAGVDGYMVLPPMRYPSDGPETLSWFRSIAAGTDRPLMLYNNPVAYGTDLTPEDVASLADCEGYVAIKESSADPRRMPAIRRLTGDRFKLFCGVDDLALECFAVGAVGWVAGLVVAFPRETVRLYELMTAGRWDEARELYDWFLPLLHLDIGPKFVHQIKLVEALLGVGSEIVRAPRMPLTGAQRAHVEAVVEQALAQRPAL